MLPNVCRLANTSGITSPSLASGCTDVKPSTLVNLFSAFTLGPVKSEPLRFCPGSDCFGSRGFGAIAAEAALNAAPTIVVTRNVSKPVQTTSGTWS